MPDPKDTWPIDYRPGPSEHLHALGVIAIMFAGYQAAMDGFYISHANMLNVPEDLIHLYYFGLSEDKKAAAVKSLLQKNEGNRDVIEAIDNLCEHYEWSRHCRNNLLHAERYPPALGDLDGVLHLTKKVKKGSNKSAYINLTLKEIRFVADSTRTGLLQTTYLRIYLAFRSKPLSSIPDKYRQYAASLPKKLHVPQFLNLALSP
jgi:hypothetical protein